MKRTVPHWLNAVLFLAMTIHIWISGIAYARNPMNSAPAYVSILNVLYYILPITLVNLFSWFRKWGRPWVCIVNILLLGAMIASGWIVAEAEFAATFYSRFPWVTAAVSLAWLLAVLALNFLAMRRPRQAE